MAFPFTGDIFPNTDFNKVNLDWICDTLQKDRADIDQNTTDIEELKNTVIDYDDLINKPQINSVTLSGNKSLSDIGAASADELDDLKSAFNENSAVEEITNWTNGKAFQLNVTTAIDITSPSDNALYRCTVLPCSAGDVFTITAESQGKAYRAWAFLDSDRKVIYVEGAVLSCTQKVLIAPTSATYLCINDRKSGGKCYKGVLDQIEINKIKSVLPEYEPLNLCDADGTFIRENQWDKGSSMSNQSQPDYFTVCNIPCQPLQKYLFHSDFTTTTARYINFFKADGTFISRTENASSATAPAEAVYMTVSFYYKVPGTDGSQKKGDYYVKKDCTVAGEYDFGSASLSGTGVKDVHNDNNIRRACINFQFDDGNANDASIVTIFKAAGFTCGFALPTSIDASNFPRYLGYQDDGFEIISHSTDGTGMNDASIDPSTIESKLKTSKETLENLGFRIKGWVTPSSRMAEVFKPILRKYYQWAITKYFGSYSGTGIPYAKPYNNVFNHFRVSLEDTTLANAKAAVDLAIANYGCLSFYSHAAQLDASGSQLTSANLADLLTYVNGKVSSGLCVVGNPSDMILEYYNTRNDDVADGWIDIPVSSVNMNSNMDTPLAWYVNYNPMLKLLSFDARLRPLTSTSAEFTLCSLPVKSLTAIPISNELGLNMRFYNGDVIVTSNWSGMAMNRTHLLCRIA